MHSQTCMCVNRAEICATKGNCGLKVTVFGGDHCYSRIWHLHLSFLQVGSPTRSLNVGFLHVASYSAAVCLTTCQVSSLRKPFVQEQADGTFFMEYQITAAGTYVLQVQYDSQAVGPAYTVVTSAGSTIRPDRCVTTFTGWDGNAATTLEAGAHLGISITARDSGAPCWPPCCLHCFTLYSFVIIYVTRVFVAQCEALLDIGFQPSSLGLCWHHCSSGQAVQFEVLKGSPRCTGS